MALTAEEYTEMAGLAADVGDEQAELEALEGLESLGALGAKPDFFGASVVEPARAVGSALGRTVAGGLAGTAQAINPFAEQGAGAQTVESIQAGTFQPETAAGQAGMQTLAALVEKGADIVNVPLSGIGGILELVSLQGIDQAAETIKSIQRQGVSSTLGERVFEETGSPLAATGAQLVPELAGAVLGTKGAGQAISAAKSASPTIQAARQGVAPVTQAVGRTAEAVASKVKEIAGDLSNVQSPTSKRIAELLVEGSDDIDTAGFRLAPGKPRPESPTKLQEFLDVGGPRVEKIPAAQEALKQGFNKGVIAAVQGSSKADKSSFADMVNIAEKVQNNARFGLRNRPSDVTGDLLMSRLRIVQDANKSAGKAIDKAANKLKTESIDLGPIESGFTESLSNMGITLARVDGKIVPNFKGSDIEGLAGPENVITRVVNRMGGTGTPTAFDAHRLKRFIDEQVTFGKNAEGLAGKAEAALKDLRKNISTTLNTDFPEYGSVNAQYSETIGVLDRFQDIAGRKLDLTGPSAEKATGTLMRRLMGNAPSRTRLLDSIDEIESAASKFGGTGQKMISGPGGSKNDLLTQVLFANELDEIIGPAARTSLQGQFDSALKRSASAASSRGGAADLALDVAGSAVEKARGINEAGAFKAIKDLLKEE